MDTKNWEKFLPLIHQNAQRGNFKNLEMPNSWVAAIEVPIDSNCFVFKKYNYFLKL